MCAFLCEIESRPSSDCTTKEIYASRMTTSIPRQSDAHDWAWKSYRERRFVCFVEWNMAGACKDVCIPGFNLKWFLFSGDRKTEALDRNSKEKQLYAFILIKPSLYARTFIISLSSIGIRWKRRIFLSKSFGNCSYNFREFGTNSRVRREFPFLVQFLNSRPNRDTEKLKGKK